MFHSQHQFNEGLSGTETLHRRRKISLTIIQNVFNRPEYGIPTHASIHSLKNGVYHSFGFDVRHLSTSVYPFLVIVSLVHALSDLGKGAQGSHTASLHRPRLSLE
jgi:hypothetical protein